MKTFSHFKMCLLLCTCLLTGCATMFGPPITPGMPAQQVIARHGKPSFVYQEGDTKILEWPVGEYSQYAYMAKVDSQDRIIAYGNVRTNAKFSEIIVNQFKFADVLKTVGHPTEVEYLPLKRRLAWSYRYKEDDMWDSMMHIYFDGNGVVTGMERTQDDLFMRENGMFGSFGRIRRR